MANLRNTTGGWRWHLRAFWRRRRWRDTSAHIADWLATTRPAHQQLLLIGGSAGWMMSGRWLQSFREVLLVDIDPHAAWLFRVNHGRALHASGTRLQFLRADGLTDLGLLLATYPHASVFFDNVLGQHLYRVPDLDQAEHELAQMASRLSGRDWGSVHDLFSGPVDPLALPPAPQHIFDADRDDRGLLVSGLRDTPLHLKLLAQVGGAGDWMDHLTSGVFPVGSRSRLIAWPFLPSYAHWLQAGWVMPGQR